jgi:porphobilinogen synthase
LRENALLRRAVSESRVSVDRLIQPAFVVEGAGKQEPIPSMPGQNRYNIDELVRYAERLVGLGVDKMLLFGIPDTKDDVGSKAYARDGIIQRAVRALKEQLGDSLLVITDVCLCEYTDHGHCGIVNERGVDNDATLPLIADTALSHAEAGADVVAPSDMMDGRVRAIRNSLDPAGYGTTPILSYAVKYASAFYGPFRDAAGSAPQFGDRRAYQMDPPNAREAIREAKLDVDEGADLVMVKPAMPYLDIVRTVRDEVNVPLLAYHVSGEYSMIKAAAERGWLDEAAIVHESLLSLFRAGCDMVMTYFAESYAERAAGESG